MQTMKDDIQFKRYGKWTVLDYSHRKGREDYWVCKCDCGTIRSVSERSLIRGRSQSCGCSRRGKFKPKTSRSDKDDLMIGKRFGRWTIVSRANDYALPTGERYDQWNCICDCGTKRVVLGGNITTGKSTSCGCYKREVSIARGIESRVLPKYTTIKEKPTLEEMMSIVFMDEENNASLENAVEKMFPYYWQKKVRLEQSIMRRYGSAEHPNCALCGNKAKTEMHHIIPVSNYGGNEEQNVIWVCNSCHTRLTKERFE